MEITVNSLYEAKKILNSNNVFYEGEDKDKFLVQETGINFIISNKFPIDEKGNPVNPIRYCECPEITENMNLAFNSSSDLVLFGKAYVDEFKEPYFELTSPTDCTDILVRSEWATFDDVPTCGHYETDYEKRIGAEYAAQVEDGLAYGGTFGHDILIVPRGYVYGYGLEDITDILKDAEKSMNEIDAETEENYKAYKNELKEKDPIAYDIEEAKKEIMKEKTTDEVKDEIDQIK